MNFKPLDIEIKYKSSGQYDEVHTYSEVFEKENKRELHLAYNDPLLKETVLDKSYKNSNIAILDMIDTFENLFNCLFLKENNNNGYCYYDKKNHTMMIDSFLLFSKDMKSLTYTDIFDDDVLKKTKSVVSVIYKKLNDKIFIADHRHEEDNTFGYPSIFNSVPGGRRDSVNPLTTFFSEAYEELKLGDKGIDFFHLSKLKGYQLNEFGTLFIFCEVNSNACVYNESDTIGTCGFKPFTLTVYKNPDEAIQKEKELSKDEFKKYKKDNSYKVLIPREQGKFDSVEAYFKEISFENDTLFGIPGRFDCYKKGSIIYTGLEYIINLLSPLTKSSYPDLTKRPLNDSEKYGTIYSC